jgi:hypothetical protein
LRKHSKQGRQGLEKDASQRDSIIIDDLLPSVLAALIKLKYA